MKSLSDFILELRIEFYFWLALNADPKSRKAGKYFDRMNELIRRRSPEQKRRLDHLAGGSK